MHDSQRVFEKVRQAVGWHKLHTTGYGFGSPATSYVLGSILSTAERPLGLSNAGSKLLDEINAFDAAEVATAHLGQINMIQVSSFCGSHGLILGRDVLPLQNAPVPLMNYRNFDTTVFSLNPCLDATIGLLGTLDAPRFSPLPGSHIPCAGKSITREGPCELYAGLAIGVDSKNGTALLMEDVGSVTDAISALEEKLVRSVQEVGKNQKVHFDEVYVGVRSQVISSGMMGCALVAAPYLTLPQWSDEILALFAKSTLESWNAHV